MEGSEATTERTSETSSRTTTRTTVKKTSRGKPSESTSYFIGSQFPVKVAEQKKYSSRTTVNFFEENGKSQSRTLETREIVQGTSTSSNGYRDNQFPTKKARIKSYIQKVDIEFK